MFHSDLFGFTNNFGIVKNLMCGNISDFELFV